MRKFPLIVSAELGELVKAVPPVPPPHAGPSFLGAEGVHRGPYVGAMRLSVPSVHSLSFRDSGVTCVDRHEESLIPSCLLQVLFLIFPPGIIEVALTQHCVNFRSSTSS